MPPKKMIAQTEQPLEAAPPLLKEKPKTPIDPQAIIHRLYELAMDGNVTAARVVLDYCHEQEKEGEGHDLTSGEILALIRTSMQSVA